MRNLFLALALFATPAAAQPAGSAQSIERTAEEETVLPEGEGRSETFAYCTVCHNSALIRRSRFTRPPSGP